MAPGQEEKWREEYEKYTNKLDIELDKKLEEFKELKTDDYRLAFIGLLSEDIPETTIMKKFDIARRFIEKARKRNVKYGKEQVPLQIQPQTEPLDMQKVRHFLSWLTNNSLLQEEAYGTVTYKFDSGKKLTESNSMLMCTRAKAVSSYLKYCKQTGYQGLGRSSLYNILNK